MDRAAPQPLSRGATLSRRWRRVGWLLLVITASLALWACWLEPVSLRITHRRIPLTLPAGYRPLRIAILTDLHVGSPHNKLDRLRRLVATTNEQAPDLIVLLGDYVITGVIGGTFVAPEPIAGELAALHARYGVYAVLGNHDYWLDAPRISATLRSAGIHLLVNAAASLETAEGNYWLIGLDDLEGQPSISQAAATIDDTRPTIVLAHNPDQFPHIPTRFTLTLAGHTHGGQVRLPFVGAPIVPSAYGQRYVSGLIEENGHTLFVSTGTGMSILPLRFRVPPQLAIITIQPRGTPTEVAP